MGSRLAAVKGRGTRPFTKNDNKTETTGSLALITWVKLPPPFSNIAHTVSACPPAFSMAMGNRVIISSKLS